MASLSLCIVMVAILLWLSGLTIVASSCGRQKPLQFQERVSPVTKCSKTGNAVKCTAFTKCKDTTRQVQASAAKRCFACMSQVWDMFKPSKSELCENTKLPFMALESPLNSTFCFGFGAPNIEVGQLKSQHCFHSATVYFYYSLQYPLSYLVLTTLVSPTLSPLRFAPSLYLPSFPLPLWYATPTPEKIKLWNSEALYILYSPPCPPLFPCRISVLHFCVLVRRKELEGEEGKKNWCFPSNMWPLLSSQLKIIWAYRPVDGWRKPPPPLSGG